MRSLHCVQTHAVIGRISGKRNLRQAGAILGHDKILCGAEERVAAGVNDLLLVCGFFMHCLYFTCYRIILQLNIHLQRPESIFNRSVHQYHNKSENIFVKGKKGGNGH